MIIKYFYEKSDEDYEEYQKIWDENRDRMIFLNLSLKERIDILKHECQNKLDKVDIISIRWPNRGFEDDNLFKQLKSGKGFEYERNKTWFPKEIWVYN